MVDQSRNLKRNPIGDWYDFLEELGERSDIILGRSVSGFPIEWITYPHQHFDGLGAFIDALSKKELFDQKIPTIRGTLAKRFLSFRALYLIFTFPPRQKVNWKKFNHEWSNTDKTHTSEYAKAWIEFDEIETQKLKEKARNEGVSLTSFLLHALTRALLPTLTTGEQKALWMLPVNLRGKVDAINITDNQSSLLPVWIVPSQSVQEIHAHLETQKKIGFHWLGWLTARFAPLISKKNARAKVRRDWFRSGHPWMGAFSNLGNFKSRKPDTGQWFFFPTVTKVRPIGVGCLGWENRLSLCMQAHPALSTSSEEIREWLKAWRSELESC